MTFKHASHQVLPRLIRCLFLSGCYLLSALLAVSYAQHTTAIAPDRTLGTTVTQKGNVYDITGGTRPRNGPNLFHSFDRFSIGTNDIASFNGPQTGIENVLSRITGGQRSMIDGTLRSTMAGANLFFLNPAGVLFGLNARLEVSGSFYVSTADFLRFADGAIFSASLGKESVLTSAPPSAFGFLRENPSAISIQGSSLRVPEGKTLSVIGGNIELVGGPETSFKAPSLGAPSGRIHLVSVASPGEVIPGSSQQASALTVDAFERLGEIAVSQSALIDASGNGGGTVVIRGGRLLVDSASLVADTLGEAHGAAVGVDMQVAESVVITHGGVIEALTTGSGNAGRIAITARTVRLDDAGFITAQTQGEGRAGDIVVAAETLTLTGGAKIDSSTSGSGPGGTVSITAADAVTITGTDSQGFPSGLFSQARGSGDAGSIVMEVGRLTLTGGGEISGETSGVGQGGTVTVTATEAVTISSGSGLFSSTRGNEDAGRIVLSAPTLRMEEAARIQVATAGEGGAGDIEVAVGTLTLMSGANINSVTVGAGLGGTVRVTADAVTIAGRSSAGGISGLFSITESGSGDAGNIVVAAGRLTLMGGGEISSSSFGAGQGGTMRVSVTDTVALSGQDSGLFALARGSGKGGDIFLEARAIELSEGAVITAESTGPGNAGRIRLTATDTFQSTHSTVTTEATQADGGDITLTAQRMVRLRDSAITAAVGGGAETVGGNIIIDPEFVILQDSQIVANAFAGQGGNIQITADVFLADPTSRVDASSALGIDGTVDIRAPVTNVSGTIAPLPQDFGRQLELLRGLCAQRLRGGERSSFVRAGRDGLPLEPGALLPSPLVGVSPVGAGSRREQGLPSVPQAGGLRVDDNGSRRIRGVHEQVSLQGALDWQCAPWGGR